MPLEMPGVIELVVDRVDLSLLGARLVFRVDALLKVNLGFFGMIVFKYGSLVSSCQCFLRTRVMVVWDWL